jgi:hypothetical protein
LCQTFPITQVNENNAAVIATAMRPTTQGNDLINLGSRHLAAVMSTHEMDFRMKVGAGGTARDEN